MRLFFYILKYMWEIHFLQTFYTMDSHVAFSSSEWQSFVISNTARNPSIIFSSFEKVDAGSRGIFLSFRTLWIILSSFFERRCPTILWGGGFLHIKHLKIPSPSDSPFHKGAHYLLSFRTYVRNLATIFSKTNFWIFYFTKKEMS